MIDKKTLDAVLPVPSLEELRDAKVEELKNEGFVITNFHSGGVFHTMLMIALRIKIEVIELLRLVAWETNIIFKTSRSSSMTSILIRSVIMSLV